LFGPNDLYKTTLDLVCILISDFLFGVYFGDVENLHIMVLEKGLFRGFFVVFSKRI
jgi:hypothetical protein